MSATNSQVANSNGSSSRRKTGESRRVSVSAARGVKARSVAEVASNMLRLSAATLYEFARDKLKR